MQWAIPPESQVYKAAPSNYVRWVANGFASSRDLRHASRFCPSRRSHSRCISTLVISMCPCGCVRGLFAKPEHLPGQLA